MVCEVLLIAGFLGAGKTTLLQNILRWPGDLTGSAILVNEFGKVGIDGDLVRSSEMAVVEMANGCICCTLQQDLERTVEQMLDRFQPRRLFIEATGVADPFDVLRVLRSPRFEGRLQSARTVTVLDADFWEAREHFGPLFYNQLKAAGLILLNKVDLQSPAAITDFLSEIREVCPTCSIMPTHYCQIDPQVLSDVEPSDDTLADTLLPMYRDLSQERLAACEPRQDAHEMGYIAFSFESELACREECLRRFLATVPIQLYRIKGFVRLENGWVFVNHVGGKTEWRESGAKEFTRLAFVGWQVDADAIVGALHTCLISENPDVQLPGVK